MRPGSRLLDPPHAGIQYSNGEFAEDGGRFSMLWRMRRRGQTDALAPVKAPRWLVVRDRLSRVVGYHALLPHADLRAAMQAERERRQASGWAVGDIPRNSGFFFCERENDRVCVSIECFEPGAGASPGWPARP
jgi:hypothetical protein